MCRSRAVVLAALFSFASSLEVLAVETQPFASATAAYRLGIASLKAGDIKAALPALEFASERGVLGAQLKLARLYANGTVIARDDAKAFYLYRQIANQRADISASSPIARYVGEAFVSLGEYYREGVQSAGVSPNPRRAADLFRHAASYFGNAEAQYALAQLYLDGKGVDKNVGLAVNWLATAAKKRHAAAQATLGEILWRGDEAVRQRSARGLALIMLARANAKETGKEPKWILDLHREALAAADARTLEAARRLTTEWGGANLALDLPMDKKGASDKLVVPALGEPVEATAPAMRSAPGAVMTDGGTAPPQSRSGSPFSLGPQP